VDRAGNIAKMIARGSLALLILLTAVAYVAVSPLVADNMTGDHSSVVALIGYASEDGHDAAPADKPRADTQKCGPTDSCVPAVLHTGISPHIGTTTQGDNVELPRPAVDLWQLLPSDPVPIV